MLTLTYNKLLILLPSILDLLVTILSLLLVFITLNKIKKEKCIMDKRYKSFAVNLRVTNFEVANQKKKLETLEEEIVNLTNKIKKLG